MSDQPSAFERGIAPAPRPGVSWIRKHRRLGLWCACLLTVATAVFVLTPAKRDEPVPYRQTPHAAQTDYVPPKAAEPVALTRPVAPQPTTVAAPQPTAPAPTQTSPATPPTAAAVYSYGNAAAALPEYMKAKMAALAPTPSETASHGGIAYKPTSFEGTKSFTLADQAYLLPKWSTIRCVLDTSIVTGASGQTPFRCHLDDAVYSPGHVLLMEAGTIVGGMYQTLVGEGQNRIVAITADARTPNGVVVELGGPIADGLGAAGAPGSVDNHWGPRIGAALLLSLSDSAFSLIQAEIQKNSQNTNISLGGGGSGGGPSNLASQLLAHTINIPPTISLNQGTRIQLWTTKYIDFSPSYRLETVR